MPRLLNRTKTPLEEQYEEACLSDLPECRKLGYNPQGWLQMMEDYGAIAATKMLVNSDKVPDGFTKLVILKRIGLTLEAGVVNPKFQPLFDPKTIANARARLVKVGYIKE